MKLLKSTIGRAYCFAETAEQLADYEPTPIHLSIEEHIELRDRQDYFVDFHIGQSSRANLTVAEAEAIIRQLEGAIAEVKSLEAQMVEHA